MKIVNQGKHFDFISFCTSKKLRIFFLAFKPWQALCSCNYTSETQCLKLSKSLWMKMAKQGKYFDFISFGTFNTKTFFLKLNQDTHCVLVIASRELNACKLPRSQWMKIVKEGKFFDFISFGNFSTKIFFLKLNQDRHCALVIASREHNACKLPRCQWIKIVKHGKHFDFISFDTFNTKNFFLAIKHERHCALVIATREYNACKLSRSPLIKKLK